MAASTSSRSHSIGYHTHKTDRLLLQYNPFAPPVPLAYRSSRASRSQLNFHFKRSTTHASACPTTQLKYQMKMALRTQQVLTTIVPTALLCIFSLLQLAPAALAFVPDASAIIARGCPHTCTAVSRSPALSASSSPSTSTTSPVSLPLPCSSPPSSSSSSCADEEADD